MGNLSDPANVTDSPELGPPPIAHFDEGDPVKFDASKGSNTDPPDVIEQDAALPTNLETRKRRRESTHRAEAGSRRISQSDGTRSGSEVSTDAGQTLRVGAKRKLNIHEENDPSSVTHNQEQNDIDPKYKIGDERKLETKPPKNVPHGAISANIAGSSAVASGTSRSSKEVHTQSSVAGTSKSRKALEPSKLL